MALLQSIGRMGWRGTKALRLAGQPRWRSGLSLGVAATVEHDRLPLAAYYGSVIDAGANRGQFALYARARFPEAKVYAIEPLEEPRATLQRLFAGDPRVEVMGFAAGAAAGTATVNITAADDSSSLLPPTKLQTSRFPGTGVEQTATVALQTLDVAFAGRELPGPLLLKLDVQGYELEVLRGAERLLECVDDVLAECSFVEFYAGQALFHDIYSHLAAKGFRLAGGAVSASGLGGWEQGDFVFRRPAAR